MNSTDKHTDPEILSAEFWARTWQEMQQEACFKESQEKHPERWQRFYDQVAPIWESVTGGGQPAAEAIASALAAQGLLIQDSTVLEVGCGSGSLTLAMAEKKARVTALDDSDGMLAVLRDRTQNLPAGKVVPVQHDWLRFEPETSHDLVLAAFLPSALTPSGLERMERLACKACALVVGTGQVTFPWRRAVWRKIMDRPLPNISFYLPCCLGFLLASGRRPDLKHISWQAHLDLPQDRVAGFYESYFAIFGKTGPEVKQLIAEVLGNYTVEGKLKLAGEASAGLITWQVQGQAP